MNDNDSKLSLQGKTALITGAAHRIGATIARHLHQRGANIVVHYRKSLQAAEQLQAELHVERPDSVSLVQADINKTDSLPRLAGEAAARWGGLDILINNASTFYPTEVGEVTEMQWDDLIGTNLKAPFFLSQASTPYLRETQGTIINIVDIHAERPLKAYPVYSMAKAGLVMMTRALASELGPDIRVNAIAPGAILWPEHEMDEETRLKIISRTFLKKQGDPSDIARAVLYLIDAAYVSGQVLTVDGGRSINS